MGTTKTAIETAIENRAKNRFDKDYKDACAAIKSNPILRELTIRIKGVDTSLFSMYSNRLFSEYQVLEDLSETNFVKIKDKLLKAYNEDETNQLLNKIDSLNDFFNQNNL